MMTAQKSSSKRRRTWYPSWMKVPPDDVQSQSSSLCAMRSIRSNQSDIASTTASILSKPYASSKAPTIDQKMEDKRQTSDDQEKEEDIPPKGSPNPQVSSSSLTRHSSSSCSASSSSSSSPSSSSAPPSRRRQSSVSRSRLRTFFLRFRSN